MIKNVRKKKRYQKAKNRARTWRSEVLKRGLILMLYMVALITFLAIAVRIDKTSIVKKELPALIINLNDISLSEVNSGSKSMVYGNNSVYIGDATYNDVELKGHGNYSWTLGKKPYRLKFSKKVNLLGMEKSKKWILHPNSVDDSLLRNDLAYYIAELVNGQNMFRGEFVELVVDGEDLGVYYLTRAMEINKQAVDLRDPMGILMELDNAYCEETDRWYLTVMGNCLTVKDVVSDDAENVAAEIFVRDFNILEKAVEDGDLRMVAEVADLKTLAEYYVISELTANQDAFVTSWFFYKDGENDKIHAGLVWDFDGAFGNRNWGNWPEEFYLPTARMARMEYVLGVDESANNFCNYGREIIADSDRPSLLVCKLMDNVEFREMARTIYEERISGKERQILEYMTRRANEIELAARWDAILWKKGDYVEEVKYVRWWLEERMDFLEKNLLYSIIKQWTTEKI